MKTLTLIGFFSILFTSGLLAFSAGINLSIRDKDEIHAREVEESISQTEAYDFGIKIEADKSYTKTFTVTELFHYDFPFVKILRDTSSISYTSK